ncbi:thiol-activated cytolysin family protein [Pseudonocardia tropica]|uniref:Thiol-activated cytolysin family protein n=1 Tax=Pseudonocardia tropica TaxID=681289 RepID=A0ABV1JTV9_9PSEU
MSNLLKAGETLPVGGTLVSANGASTLLLRDDGDLVLHRGPVRATTIYWRSGTSGLPTSGPLRARLSDDGSLTLVDSSGLRRWRSGTWGTGIVDPTLFLADDGNLVVRHNDDDVLWASGAPGGAGRIELGFVDLAARASTRSDSLSQAGRMPPVVSSEVSLGTAPPKTETSNGVAYLITEERRRAVNAVVEQAYLQDIGRLGVYPGQPVQGQALLSGDLAEIGPLPRVGGRISIVTDMIHTEDVGVGTPLGQSRTLDTIDATGVNQARRDIIAEADPADSVSQLKTTFERASTLREIGVKAGLDITGSNFSVDANASLNQSYRQNTVVGVIRQVFYSARFEALDSRSEGFWPDGVQLADLQPFFGPGNPPLYVDSVQYGRLIVVTAQGAFSTSQLRAAMSASYTQGVQASGSIALEHREVLESAVVKVYTVGVPGVLNFRSIADPVTELPAVYAGGLVFNSRNLGAPVSFVARHIADNRLAMVALTAEYVTPLTAVGVDVPETPFEVWDGPGGGLRDTRIQVNPGDTVTISTGGAIWSGVFGAGTHGPEGWPGHDADRGAPLPSGTAYCLIASFDGHTWFEAGGFWQGKVPAGSGGRILLAVNDNNPYNGNPDEKWTSLVSVVRADAAAAGIRV